METTAAVRLPSLLAQFHRRFPAVQLTLRTAPTADLVAGVLDGTFDGAFVAGPIDHAELTATTAFKEELVLVTARRWTSLAALRAGTPNPVRQRWCSAPDAPTGSGSNTSWQGLAGPLPHGSNLGRWTA